MIMIPHKIPPIFPYITRMRLPCLQKNQWPPPPLKILQGYCLCLKIYK